MKPSNCAMTNGNDSFNQIRKLSNYYFDNITSTKYCYKVVFQFQSFMGFMQGVWNRSCCLGPWRPVHRGIMTNCTLPARDRESRGRQLRRPRGAGQVFSSVFALQTVLHFNKKYSEQVMYMRYLYTRQTFLTQMEYRLQSMYNHMVGRAASFVSPFYSIILGFY